MNRQRKKIGILGGGQLARMLALKAHQMGLEPFVLSPSKEDPAAKVTRFWLKGSLSKARDIEKLLRKTDLVIFENEFLNKDLLLKAMKKTKNKTKIRPDPRLIGRLQDRLSQKKLLQKFNIPTAPFLKVSDEKDLLFAFDFFKGRMVLKKRLFGYDGYGTFIIQNKKELKQAKKLLKEEAGFIAEAFIPFKRELSLILASHRLSKKAAALPLVETRQKNFRCFWLKGPVKSSPQMKKLEARLKNFVRKIKYEGVIAFELFQKGGDFLVNEMAPRVHNSGHYSLEALSKDQFTLHLEAVLRRPLKSPELLSRGFSRGFAMVNLLGKIEPSPAWRKYPRVFLHDYAKKQKRRGRKMGHLTALDSSPDRALKKLLGLLRFFS